MPRAQREGGGEKAQKSMAVRLIEARSGQAFPALIRARRRKGRTFRQIGAEFGLSGQTVWRHWKQFEGSTADGRATAR